MPHDLCFYYYYRESPLLENPKTLRNLIKNIGGGTSPILNRKSQSCVKKQLDPEVSVTKLTNVKGRLNSLSKSEVVSKRSISCDSRLTRKRDSSIDTEKKSKDKVESNYVLLSQVSIQSCFIFRFHIGRDAT